MQGINTAIVSSERSDECRIKTALKCGQRNEDQTQRVEDAKPSAERLEGNIIAGSKPRCDLDDERQRRGAKQDD